MNKKKVLIFLLSFFIPMSKINSLAKKHINFTGNVQSLKNESLDDYIKYFNNFEMNSILKDEKLEDELISENIVAELFNQLKFQKNCTYHYDGNMHDLVEKIKENSSVYLNKHPEYKSAFVNENDIDFEDVLYRVLDDFNTESVNNIDEDICKMQTLKIVYNKNTILSNEKENYVTLGKYISDDNLIIIDYDEILKNLNLDEDINDKLELVVEHELGHIRQTACNHRLEEGQLYSSVGMYADVNSSFILESSAESELYNLDKDWYRNISSEESLNTLNYNYYEERKFESLLLLLGLFHDNQMIDDYYQAIMDSDLKKLYDFFNIKTEEDAYNFYRILYAMDSYFGRSDYVFKFYDKESVNLLEIKKSVGFNFKVEIFHQVLRNMINYTINNNDFTLDDNVLLLNIIKSYITDESYYYEKNGEDIKTVYEDEFVKNVYALENKYVSFLSKFYDVSVDEIRQKEIDKNIFLYDLSVCCYYRNESNCCENVAISLEIERILEKFPLLKEIMFSNLCSTYNYTKFLEDNNLEYILKK